MDPTAPHYLLFTQANSLTTGGRWKFVLEQIGSDFRIEESDEEPHVRGERLQLFAVIRGLEALEQASNVTLVTPSRYVGRGIRSGLPLWRNQDWQVEKDGSMKPLRHAKLWQRIDAAMQFHKINCRVWQFDAPHTRTQSHSHDNSDKAASPFVAPFAETMLKIKRTDRSNRIRIDDGVRQNNFKSSNTAIHLATQLLSERIKPVGQGRAYGYAVN
jgi:ribonuclease HI